MVIHSIPSERSPSLAAPTQARRGSVTIFTVIIVVALVCVVGLGLDTALVMTARQQLQRTADAAALAAAAKVKIPNQTDYDLTRRAAYDTAAAMSNDIVRCGPAGIVLDMNAANIDDDANHLGDIVVGRWAFNTGTHQFGFMATNPGTGIPSPNAVKVRAKCAAGSENSALELLFSSIFGGPTTSNVGRTAIAQLGRRPDPLILILHRTQRWALRMDGGVHMDVLAGTIQVDSNHSCAFQINGSSGLMEAQSSRVVGGACLDPTNLTGDLITGASYVPDPLINLPAPDPSTMVNRGGITGQGTYQPGYYPDGIEFGSGTATLQSGIYVIGSNPQARGIKLTGNAILRSGPGGVLIYTEPNADVRTSGSGSGLELAPMLSGIYNGVTIFMARTGSGEANIGGLGTFVIRGTFYVPNGHLDMHGNVNRTVGRIIVDTQSISGDANYVITGDDVPEPTGPQYVYLVN